MAYPSSSSSSLASLHRDDTTDVTQVSSAPTSPNTQLSIHGNGSARRQNKASALRSLAEAQFPMADTQLILRSLDGYTERNFKASFCDGIQQREIIQGAILPTVSIVFMPGSDKITVNQQEERSMTQAEADQKSPRWRVTTAGTLLRSFEVGSDMKVLYTDDHTHEVVAKARKRLNIETTFNASTKATAQKKQEDRTVTIDSDNVQILSRPTQTGADLEATLVEVDQASLLGLITNYLDMITESGPPLTTEATLNLLYVMIEDARRLAIRSPVLFRMSTRTRIIRSRNTRYGVDHGTMFQTIATSRSIKSLISRSTGCYSILDTPGTDSQAKKLIRPKFLQMLVLLISLLNDSDLAELGPHLEKTFGIDSSRQHIELLILKVLPLMSINTSIFVRELVNTVEEAHYPNFPQEESHIWNIFIERRLSEGYILPASVHHLGQDRRSWIVKWPDEGGFKNSSVFNDLQYNGKYKTINEVPPIDLTAEREAALVTVFLTNGQQYMMRNQDHERVIAMVPGRYPITELKEIKRLHDLEIREVVVNDEANDALQRINSILTIMNGYFAGLKLKAGAMALIKPPLKLFGIKPKARVAVFENLKGCGRLTYHEAILGNQLLATAHKIDGKKISALDLVRNLAIDIQQVQGACQAATAELLKFEGKFVDAEVKQTLFDVRNSLVRISQLVVSAEKQRERMERGHRDLGDEPIIQTIYPGRVDVSNQQFWSEYTARIQDNHLWIESHRHQVTQVNWITDEVIEVYFANNRNKYFVSPLDKVPFGERNAQIQTGDTALLLGQYVVIVEMNQEEDLNYQRQQPFDGPPRKPAEVFVNWLKITGIKTDLVDQASMIRFRNRRKANTMVESVFL